MRNVVELDIVNLSLQDLASLVESVSTSYRTTIVKEEIGSRGIIVFAVALVYLRLPCDA